MEFGQSGWRWCSLCGGLFFAAHTQGRCPASGDAHDATGSGAYVVDQGESGRAGQQDWRWCGKCEGLFFAGNSTAGSCPADAAGHDASQSGSYMLHDSAANDNAQSGWQWCRQCQGLFFGAGRCPAGGEHDGSESGDYVLQFDEHGTAQDFDPALQAIRLQADRLVRSYVPCETGDAKFGHIAKDYTGGGTTCGFLCHWLLWRLGCDDATIVNRKEPGFRYVDAMNIARIWNRGEAPFVKVIGTDKMQQGLEPECGDIVFIKQDPNGPQNTEHVFVFLAKETRDGKIFWSTAESGQKNQAGQECARLKQRELTLGTKRDAKVTGNMPERTVFGWLALSNLRYNSAPMPDDPRLLTD